MGEAKRLLKELEEIIQKTYVLPSAIARIYLGLGESDKDFDWFDKAIDDHDSATLHPPVYPIFDPLRAHPCYHALLRKMNLG
jgi:hypothetical protein